MYSLGHGKEGSVRTTGEKALMAVGNHVAEGALIWQCVILAERQVGWCGEAYLL